jgi:serine/threonine protein kinase
MADPLESLPDLPSEGHRQIEGILERFEAAWERGDQPVLDKYLPPGESRVLAELVHVDLERRLKAGDAVRVEHYLARYPDLASKREAVLALVAAEYILRRRQEPSLEMEEYARRFPDYYDDLLSRYRLPTTIDEQPAPPALPPRNQEAWRVDFSGVDAALALRGIPGYEVLGVLGRGGMGVVYQAREVKLKRLVALKTILAGSLAGAGELVRFTREAEAAARLRHPNIVQIYQIGEHLGVPYLALEFIDGPSLKQRLSGQVLEPEQAGRLVETLARAMHYAHERGIVHRDLKPGNVLVGTDGVPKICDFGLAKLLDEGTGQTRSGDILGTPSYMAPEQAAGNVRDVGPATDVYALGAIFYELLTGRPPFCAATSHQTLAEVRNRPPLPPRQLRPGLSRDLEAICLQCLQKQPHNRYPSALALAEDLQRAVVLGPVSARPPALWKSRSEWSRLLGWPLLVAGLLLASVGTLCVTLLGFRGNQGPTQVEQDIGVPIEAHVQAGRKALAAGKFRLAADELQQAVARLESQPKRRRGAEGRDAAQLHRQAALLADLLSQSLEEVLQLAAGSNEEEWQAKFTQDYRTRAVLFDVDVTRDDEGRYRLDYHVVAGIEPARIEVGDLKLLRALPRDRPPRLLFGARLASISREPPGVWVVRFQPDSGVLLTDPATVAASCPPPYDQELMDLVRRQKTWVDELP